MVCMRVFCDCELRIEGNKRKNVYDARRSIEEAINKISGEYFSADVNYFGTRKIINSHRIGDLFHLFRILLWHELQAQMAAKRLLADITCLYYFGSDIEADQPLLD